MVEIHKVTDKEQWDDYALENGAHPLQLWGWGQLKSQHGWSADRVFIYDEDVLVGAAQMLVRKLPQPLKAFAYVPRGPIAGAGWKPEYLDELADYAKRHFKAVTLSVEPDSEEFETPKGWVKSSNRILPPRTVLLDLTQNESQLLADMSKKTRQYIRKSAADGIVIKTVRTREELERCLDIYRETAGRAQFALHNEQYYIDVFNSLQDHSPVFAAYYNDAPVAFLWLAISEKTAYELYGGMSELGSDLRANYALKWYAIRKVKEWGLERYDFGGLINDGVNTFKLSWAVGDTNLAGTFDKPLSGFYSLWNKGLPSAKRLMQRLRALFK